MVPVLRTGYVANVFAVLRRVDYGLLEDWTFAPDGRMRKRQMSGNEIQVAEEDRWFKDDFTTEDVDKVPIGEEHW